MYENELYSNGEHYQSAASGDQKAQTSDTQRQEESNRYFDRVEESSRHYQSDTWSGANPYPTEPVKKQKQKKNGKGTGFFRKAVCAVALAAIFGSVAGGTFYGICKYTGVFDVQESRHSTSQQLPQEGVMKPTEPNANSEIKDVKADTAAVVYDYSEMLEEVTPAVVTIQNTCVVNEPTFWGQYVSREAVGSGTGIIIGENDTELLVATNQHVVADTVKLEITFIDGTTVEGKVKGQDAEMDLAVVAISLKDLKQETKDAIAVAKLGESEQLKIGQPVVVIGNALGIGISATDGIISGLNREMTSEDGTTGTFIQTNAEVNHGNSGGALLNAQGEVIGIVSGKIDDVEVEGMGYAIPIDAASDIISELKERTTRTDKVGDEERGYLGVTLQTVTNEAMVYYNMPSGAYIVEVTEGSAADKAGIVHGDVITKVDGERVTSKEQAVDILEYFKVGETVKVTIQRQETGEYVPHEFTITLGERPE